MSSINMQDGWPVAPPGEHDLDPAVIGRLGPRLRASVDANLHAILVARHGTLVYEEYFAGEDHRWGEGYVGRVAYDASLNHDLRSITKSVTSLLVGVAVGRGQIASLDTPVFAFFPEHADLRTPDKDRITLRHLLTMSTGLAWNQDLPYSRPENSMRRMAVAPDPYRYVLERPVTDPPGAVHRYSDGATELLAGIVRKVSGMPLDEYAREALFGPLGITNAQWMYYPNGRPAGASGLRLRPRDLAKIGQLVLDRGIWHGREIVPAAWIEGSTTPHITAAREGHFYGYQWWLGRSLVAGREVSWTAGFGFGGQRLFIVPSEQIVVVVLAGLYHLDMRFTRAAGAAIAQAREEARRLNRASLRPEHIFLGVVGQPRAVAGWVLARLGVTLEAARETVTALVGPGDQPARDGGIAFSPGATRVVTLALEEAGRLGHEWFGTEHLLLALFQIHDLPEAVAVQGVMQRFGLAAERVRDLLLEELSAGRRFAGPPDAGRTDDRQFAPGHDAGSVVLDDFVLPAVLR